MSGPTLVGLRIANAGGLMSSVDRFSTGLQRARQVRRQLLESFDAEDEWLWGNDWDPTVMWAPGPLGTRFMVEPVSDSVPGLGIVHVFTICATAFDVDAARATVTDLNFHTTFERWSVLNDPGLDLTSAVATDDPYRLPLSPRHDEDAPISVASGVSFVVGDPDVELPFNAMRAIVAGAIAKATAVATNGFADPWGQVDVVHDESGTMRPGEDWNRIVYFFDDEITPQRDASAGALADALVQAFELERELQFRTCPAAWFGSGDRTGFTCEVPYGPGPFPLGVIGMNAMAPHLAGPENATSLVRGLLQANPYVGNGLVVAVTTGGSGPSNDVPAELLPALLNAQNRLRKDEASPGFAHAVGAWVSQMGITHVTFIPAAWRNLLDWDELVQFFRVMLANAARLSWGSRQVMEPYRDRPLSDITTPSLPNGLAAGAQARGSHFGEPGAGQDPGAVALGFVWDNLVGPDDEYAVEFNDIDGFRFWMGPAVVDVTSHPCECTDEQGSVLVIESDLGKDTPVLRDLLGEILDDSHPFGIAADNGRLIAVAQIHVHDDTVSFGSRWAVPLATAIAMLADRLPPASERGVDLAMPDGTVRPGRDGMLGSPGELGLWDPLAEWIAEGRAQSQEVGLLHALTLTANPGFRVAADDGGLVVSRTYSYRTNEDDDWVALVLDTRNTYVDHPQYGRSLLITTDVPTTSADAFDATNAFRREGFTLLGGFTAIGVGVRLTTLYPLALDRSWTHTGQVSFAGTALEHHRAVVHRSLWWVQGATARTADAADVAGGLTDLIGTYRSMGNAPESLDVAAAPWHDEVAVQWMRPWPYSGLDASPRLCSDLTINDEGWLGGQIVVDPASIDPWPLRVVHAVLALSAPPDPSRLEVGSLLTELAFLPGPETVASFYRRAEHIFDVIEDEDGDFLIQDEEGEPIAQLIFRLRDDHQGWGTSLDVVARMLVPAALEGDPRAIHPTVIGAWSEFDDALEYHISLPPLLFACLETSQPRHEAVMCVAPAIAHARAAARAGRTQ